jgi:hypothetical protein
MTAKKTKLTLVIGEKLNRRLDFQAAIRGADRSAILAALIDDLICLPQDVDVLLACCARPSCPPDVVASRADGERDGRRIKTTFYLPDMTAARLKLHADSTGEDRSTTAERLIRDNVAPWEFYDPREKFLSSYRKDRQSQAPSMNPAAAAGD